MSYTVNRLPRAAKHDSGIGMIRTVVNDPAAPQYHDRYAVKLVKYIPGEVLAAFIPLVALADKIRSPGHVWVWVTIAVGAVCVVGYNRWQATDMLLRQLKSVHDANGPDPWPAAKIRLVYKQLQPAWFFYVLALVAFAAWALATAEPVRVAVGLSPAEAEYIVATVTFCLPLADATLVHFSAWSRTRRKARGKEGVASRKRFISPQP